MPTPAPRRKKPVSMIAIVASALLLLWVLAYTLDAHDSAKAANVTQGVAAMHADSLHQRLLNAERSDTLEHRTELLIWDAPRQLRQRRAELASRLADDQAGDRQPERQDDPANPFIAVEQQAIARIDARLQQLQAAQ